MPILLFLITDDNYAEFIDFIIYNECCLYAVFAVQFIIRIKYYDFFNPFNPESI